MIILPMRIFLRFVIMLCTSLYVQAALNFVRNDDIPTHQSIPKNVTPQQAKSLATQLDVDSVKTQSPIIPNTALDSENAEDETVEFYFEDANLENLLSQIALLYDVTFLTDDMISPLPEKAKAIKGNKISFKTNQPLTRKAAWNIFLTFLEIAGFALTKESKPNIYRVVSIDVAKKSPLPAYIGTKPQSLPKNDQIIRYVYFVQNSSLDTIDPIVNALRSNISSYAVLKDLQAFMLTDKAYNIASLMEIVSELDKVTMPQSMSVLKLQRADVQDVKKLYESLTQTEDKGVTARLFPTRKQPTTVYFPENLRLIAYPRTNALILLGAEDAIKKIENFITTYVDIDITAPYPPIRMHVLKYADATRVSEIMNAMTDFGKDTEAGKSGGVRGGDKYLKKMLFTPEPETNRLIIQGDEDDYQAVKEILKKLDEEQPQVAIDVLVLAVSIDDNRQLGSQIRSKVSSGTKIPGVAFQTSGFLGNGIQTNPETTPPVPGSTGASRLLANLIELAVGARAGNTILSLGTDMFGVWGMLQALQTLTNTQVVANPFLVATNKTPAKVEIGQTRRVVVATVVGQQDVSSEDDKSANLKVALTPQINSDGMIILDLDITLDQFAEPTDFTSATVNTKALKTSTMLSNGEVLALGGLIQNSSVMSTSETPILGKIPILRWLFKNKGNEDTKNNLLILICPRILPPDSDKEATNLTNDRILGYHTTLADMISPADCRDPVNKFFFEPKNDSSNKIMENFLIDRYTPPRERLRGQAKRLKKNQRARKRSSRSPFIDKNEEKTEQKMAIHEKTKVNAIVKEKLAEPSSVQEPEQLPTLATPKKRQSLSTMITNTESINNQHPGVHS